MSKKNFVNLLVGYNLAGKYEVSYNYQNYTIVDVYLPVPYKVINFIMKNVIIGFKLHKKQETTAKFFTQ